MFRVFVIVGGLVIGLLLLALFAFPDKNLHVVFCDVGQGDAILVTQGTMQMLVDGGPDSSVISCLGNHMPFWDRTVEVVVNTHPQLDHFSGLVDVVRRYRVGLFVEDGQQSESDGWKTLEGELGKRQVRRKVVKTADQLRYSNLLFDILNPPEGLVATDLNHYSLVGRLSFGSFDVLLTGDIMPPSTDTVAAQLTQSVEVLKVPHHGSKNGLDQLLLEKANPRLAVISVGKKNQYGHPHQETLGLLRDKGIKILRTDQDGEVEVVSDGTQWWVNK